MLLHFLRSLCHDCVCVSLFPARRREDASTDDFLRWLHSAQNTAADISMEDAPLLQSDHDTAAEDTTTPLRTAGESVVTFIDLPDEIVGLFARSFWNPVKPHVVANLAATCRRVHAIVRAAATTEFQQGNVLKKGASSKQLAAWGSVVLGPPWHLSGRTTRRALQSCTYAVLEPTSGCVTVAAAAARL
jgi:hypothetical protein